MWYITIIVVAVFLFFLPIHLRRRKNAKAKVINVIQDNCMGCRRCLKCPRDIFDIEKGHAIVKNPDNCTACGKCIPVCKFNALELVDRR